MRYGDQPRHQKATLGETIVDEWLRAKGWVPYHPVFDGPHPFDRLVASPDKRRLAIVEIKTKPRRNAYPDTGINLSHFDDYMQVHLKYQIPIFLAFVDEQLKQIYGEFLSELIKSREVGAGWRKQTYPLREQGIIYFPIEAMRVLATLTDEQCAALKALRRTNWVDEKDIVIAEAIPPHVQTTRGGLIKE